MTQLLRASESVFFWNLCTWCVCDDIMDSLSGYMKAPGLVSEHSLEYMSCAMKLQSSAG